MQAVCEYRNSFVVKSRQLRPAVTKIKRKHCSFKIATAFYILSCRVFTERCERRAELATECSKDSPRNREFERTQHANCGKKGYRTRMVSCGFEIADQDTSNRCTQKQLL